MPYRNALIPKMCPPLNLSYWHMYLRRRAYTFRVSRRSECIEAIILDEISHFSVSKNYIKKLLVVSRVTNFAFYKLQLRVEDQGRI